MFSKIIVILFFQRGVFHNDKTSLSYLKLILNLINGNIINFQLEPNEDVGGILWIEKGDGEHFFFGMEMEIE